MNAQEYEPDLAVVIPLYNKGKCIERALRSVFQQTQLPDELVVVDDGSTDEGPRLAREIVQNEGFGVVVSISNQGVSVARNQGVLIAKSEIVCFLDADDEWCPNHLKNILSLSKNNVRCDFFSLRHTRKSPDGSYIKQNVCLPSGYCGEVDNFLEVYRKGYGVVHSSTVAFRRDTFLELGGFPVGARKSQDIYLWLKAGIAARFAYCDNVGAIRHEDVLGTTGRKGVVPYHFVYFLEGDGVDLVRKNGCLRRFLRKNIILHAVTHRMNQDHAVTSVLNKLSRRLGFFVWLCATFIRFVPRSVLFGVKFLARRRRLIK